jgi:phospholipase/carboxylesterase
MSDLIHAERPAENEPSGLLVLHHGRGTDEHDLLPLVDLLDPGRRLHVVSARGPLQLPGSPGYHWYVAQRVGYPDPDTFYAAHSKLAALHDELWERTGLGPEQTVLGGFSMGAVMSYALGLTRERPVPAGLLAFSGFVPAVSGWQPSLLDRPKLRAFVAHGRLDPIISIEFGRAARNLLSDCGVDLVYREHGGGHQIDPSHLEAAAGWLEEAVSGASGGPGAGAAGSGGGAR